MSINWLKKSKKAQLDFEEISIVGILGALVGGMVSIWITKQMEGGLVLRIIGFFVTAIICYFVASKVADE